MAATITIKNIPSHIYDLLKKNAERNHRSINNEVISVIERMYVSVKINPAELLARARELRKRSGKHVLTEEVLNQAKTDGRP